MSSIFEEKLIISDEYIRLSQYFFINNESYISQFLEKGDINYAIPSTTLVRLHNPNLLGYTPLHFAVEEGRLNLTSLLLKHGADISIKNFNSFTPLRMAIEKSEIKYEKSLLNIKGMVKHRLIDVLLMRHVETKNASNPKCKFGISHFHIACMNNFEASEFFLKVGIDVNDPINIDSPFLPGYTPLHIAVRYSCFEVALLLINHGANVNLKNSEGFTPLHLLIIRNLEIVDFLKSIELDSCHHSNLITEQNVNEEIIKLLINEVSEIDDIGLTLTHVACTIKDQSVVENFLERNVDVNVAVNLDSPLWSGYTPLHFASHFNIEIVRLLLTKGATVIVKDASGLTPIDICMERYESKGVCSIFTSLSLDKDFKYIKFSDGTKLIDFVFAMQNHKNFSQFLKNKGYITIPLDSPIWPGCTPSHIAVIFSKKIANYNKMYGKLEYILHYSFNHLKRNEAQNLVKTCLDRDDDFDTKDANGLTPLHLALKLKKFNIVQSIIKCPREKIINPSDNDNVSYLMMACAYNNEKLVRDILGQNPDVNCQIKTGKMLKDGVFVTAGSTALHVSVIFGYFELTKLLLQNGAGPMIKDSEGSTAIHLVFEKSSESSKVSDILIEASSKIMNSTSTTGLSHLKIACYVNQLDIVKNLYKSTEEDLSTSPTNLLKETALDALDQNRFRKNQKSRFDSSEFRVPPIHFSPGDTPLHFAVNGSALETIDFLINQSASIHTKNKIGLSPLHIALMKEDENVEKILKIFLPKLDGNKKECIDDTGLTYLHILCKIFDKNGIDNVLRSADVDVNARVNLDSPVWPGDTPLHVLISNMKRSNKNYDEILEVVALLLKFGADVTLKNKQNQTPLRIAQDESKSIAKALMQSSTIFNSNPIDSEGFSHFHIACLIGEADVVEEFLKRGVSINQPKDFFTTKYFGYSPLHFAVRNESSYKEIIGALIKHGVDFKSSSSEGQLPIQTLVKSFSSDIERLTFFFNLPKVDINAVNVFGFTSLQLHLIERFPKTKVIKLFLKNKALVNLFNPVIYADFKEGCLAKILNHSVDLFFNTLLHYSVDLNTVNNDRSNAIHNIVSIDRVTISDEVYTAAIYQLLKRGCELDSQDITGKTPLQLAHEFLNETAIVGLLNNGADINVIYENKTPLHSSLVNDDILSRQYIAKKYFQYMKKLIYFGLELHEQNKYCYQQMLSNDNLRLEVDSTVNESKLDQLKEIILFKNFKLNDFLFKNKFKKFEVLSIHERKAIRKVLESETLNNNKFFEVNCLLQLQYRKALVRSNLIKLARSPMLQLRLPDLCVDKILKFLSNEDLRNLAATIEPKNFN